MPKKWKVLSSKISYKDRWLKVRSDSCVTSEGVSISPYHVLEQPTWANVVALTKNLDIVLVKQYRHGVGKVVTEIPSGVIEPEDESPVFAIKRELLEETGYSSDSFFQTGVFYANPANQDNLTYSFLATDLEIASSQELDKNEDIEVVTMRFVDFLRKIETSRNTTPTQGLHLASLQNTLFHIIKAKEAKFGELRKIILDFLQ